MNTLTNEQEAKVFGMYAPCEVEHTDSMGAKETARLIAVDFSSGDLVCTEPSGGMYDYNIQNCKIIAKPLSEISDEDAVEMAYIHWPDMRGKDVNVEWLKMTLGTICRMSDITDFLRSKSYALPYMGIDLYEAGIAIKPTDIL